MALRFTQGNLGASAHMRYASGRAGVLGNAFLDRGGSRTSNGDGGRWLHNERGALARSSARGGDVVHVKLGGNVPWGAGRGTEVELAALGGGRGGEVVVPLDVGEEGVAGAAEPRADGAVLVRVFLEDVLVFILFFFFFYLLADGSFDV